MSMKNNFYAQVSSFIDGILRFLLLDVTFQFTSAAIFRLIFWVSFQKDLKAQIDALVPKAVAGKLTFWNMKWNSLSWHLNMALTDTVPERLCCFLQG